MPQPWTYRHASQEYRGFLDDIKDKMDLTSDNMAYTAVDGVFQTFRKRVTAAQGLAFASILPCVPRAIFVANWVPSEEPEPWLGRDALIEEAQSLRKHHNLTPSNCIEATAWALRRSIQSKDWDRAMLALPQIAQDFWFVEIADPKELEPGIR